MYDQRRQPAVAPLSGGYLSEIAKERGSQRGAPTALAVTNMLQDSSLGPTLALMMLSCRGTLLQYLAARLPSSA